MLKITEEMEQELNELEPIDRVQSILEMYDSSVKDENFKKFISEQELDEYNEAYITTLSMVLKYTTPLSALMANIRKYFDTKEELCSFIDNLNPELFDFQYKEVWDNKLKQYKMESFISCKIQLPRAVTNNFKRSVIAPLVRPSTSVQPYNNIKVAAVKKYNKPTISFNDSDNNSDIVLDDDIIDNYDWVEPTKVQQKQVDRLKCLKMNHDHIKRVNNIKFKLKSDSSFVNHTKMPTATAKAYSETSSELKEFLALHTDGEFYLAHAYDSRGRVYSRGYQINYQGTDFNKAEIHFANGEKVELD